MKKAFLVVLLAFGVGYNLTKTSVPFTFVDSTAAVASEVNANFDTLDNTLDKVIDTVNTAVVRYSPNSSTTDSTVQYIQIDTIRSNPDVDTILGRPHIDTVETDFIVVNDSAKITGHVKVTQDVTADSLVASTGARVSNDLTVANDVISDSLIGSTGIRSGNDVLADEDVTATNDVTGDSCIGTTGMRTGGDIIAGEDAEITDSVKAGGAVVATGNIVAAKLNTGQGDNELYDMDQNVQTTDAVDFATVNTGQGDNDLYDMDQDVLTTSDVIFDSLSLTDDLTVLTGKILANRLLGFGQAGQVTLSTDTATITETFSRIVSETGKVDTLRMAKAGDPAYSTGDMLILVGTAGDSIVIVEQGVPNGFRVSGSTRALEDNDYIMFIYQGGLWEEISHSDN